MGWMHGPWVIEFANMRPSKIRERKAAEIGPPRPKKKFKITRVDMKAGDRMARIAVGQNKGRLFFRVDLWKVGYRLTRETA